MGFSLINTVFLSLIGFVMLTAFQFPKLDKSDFLWRVVNEQCVPNQKSKGQPSPCVEVSFTDHNGTKGYAIYKDRRGLLQYLLLPTSKIGGIESAEILQSNTPNYFYEAWKSKAHMEKLFHSAIDDEDLALAINSVYARSQKQLHIHVSCIDSDVKDLIHDNLSSITDAWSEFPDGIFGHTYFARRISMEQFQKQNMFQLLARDLPEAKDNMKEFGLGLVAIKEGKTLSFVLLANRANLSQMNAGGAEEIQDHDCSQLVSP